MADVVARFVAPLAGVWIEISVLTFLVLHQWVAPLAGVWIEIRLNNVIFMVVTVAPLAGVWIEISMEKAQAVAEERRSPCGSVD